MTLGAYFMSVLIGALLCATHPLCAAPQAATAQSLIEQGRYLATAGDCISCHTRANGDAFSGGRPLNTPFGVIYSANITPDRMAGIGAWSELELGRAMREGIAADGDQPASTRHTPRYRTRIFMPFTLICGR